jgi:hypothetical protein
LKLPDFDKHFELVADACQVPLATGAVLLYGGGHVAYPSRKSPTVQHDSVTDNEMLAVISALSKCWFPLEGHKFTPVTSDHKRCLGCVAS